MSTNNLNRNLQSPSLSAEDFSLLDDAKLLEKSQNIQYAITKCTTYLCYVKEPSKLLVDKRAQRAIEYLRKKSKKSVTFEPFFRNDDKTIQVFVSLLVYYKNDLDQFLDSFNYVKLEENDGLQLVLLSQFMLIRNLAIIICNVTNFSKSFCYKFHEFNGTKAILDYLDDDETIKKLLNFKNKELEQCKTDGVSFVCRLLDSMHNLSLIIDNYKKDFEDLNVVNIIMKYLHNEAIPINSRTAAYMALANTLNDHEIETLPDVKQAIENIVNMLHLAANSLESKDNLKRIKVDVEIDGEKSHKSAEVCLVDNSWHLIELLNSLYRLAINDKVKVDLYETHNIQDDIKKIIFHGNDIEKTFAVKLLWQLCFNEKICGKIYQDKDLFKAIESISNDTSKIPKYLKKYCTGALWSIGKSVASQISQKLEMSGIHAMRFKQALTPEKKEHIMISYNKDSRDLCLKIKEAFEKVGQKIWIDVENIHGSSLESMATAIEDSKCVLICMTEKYKQSPYCRAEAEYAFKLNRPIVPLIMQNNWQPDGWLGIILGSKIYINFTKYSFQECLKRLFMEFNSLFPDELKPKDIEKPTAITPITTIKPPVTPVTTVTPITSTKPITPIVSPSVYVDNWTVDDVNNWLKQHNVNPEISKMLNKFNGILLKRLYKTYSNASNYFFSAISKDNKIDMFSVLHFTEELENLFK